MLPSLLWAFRGTISKSPLFHVNDVRTVEYNTETVSESAGHPINSKESQHYPIIKSLFLSKSNYVHSFAQKVELFPEV